MQWCFSQVSQLIPFHQDLQATLADILLRIQSQLQLRLTEQHITLKYSNAHLSTKARYTVLHVNTKLPHHLPFPRILAPVPQAIEKKKEGDPMAQRRCMIDGAGESDREIEKGGEWIESRRREREFVSELHWSWYSTAQTGSGRSRFEKGGKDNGYEQMEYCRGIRKDVTWVGLDPRRRQR